ncbi:nucleoside phosphorylase [Muricauda sp. SCSIO 64092]|uniref:nucleoside phosphorylase n=1 Tax=Allomuricauda sp. SCSIO 64092 TaxID=2908842 RepID=UPI001FF1D33E|nr:nucleoside phosphorylase [Muricauda sp. SCSIO 64092]UOY06457.1 nucleoside phosphorylase [Muricauda sp. SCSIO 64092]
MPIGESELILNADGSIYHLNLLPEDIAPTVIVVGDPNRVQQVSRYFDTIELKKQKREFLTHTGMLNGKRLTVLSTGIGTGNIDIVLNELDALVNIDFSTREIKPTGNTLDIVRIGTSGALQPDIPVDSFLLSHYAIGLDGILHFYEKEHVEIDEMTQSLIAHLGWTEKGIVPYTTICHQELEKQLESNRIRLGMTLTNAGFYGPQGRELRLKQKLTDFHSKLASFRYQDKSITNLEMETATIYGLSRLLGHRAVSLNAILANRPLGTFSKNPLKMVDSLIKLSLELLT